MNCHDCFNCKVKVKLVPSGRKIFQEDFFNSKFEFGEVRCSQGLWQKSDGTELRYKRLKSFKESTPIRLTQTGRNCPAFTLG